MKQYINTKVLFILLVLIVAALVAAIALSRTSPVNEPGLTASPAAPSAATQEAPRDVNAQLLYLIEEEKLAYDVYSAMFDLYGARVFGNILNSEATHQDRVLSLLNVRGIADPRSSEPGVFVNQELQQLYSQLIAQGTRSEADAFAVGVAIEEKDIADITMLLGIVDDREITAVLESLLSASQSHLRAFNNQLR